MNLNQVKKLMDRKKNSRKGENGKVLVIGGSEQFVGAVALAGLAALRAGCDMVTIAAPDKIAWAINRYAPDLVTQKIKLAFTVKLAREMVRGADVYDAVLLGNGITRKADKFCHYFIRKSSRLKVVDADALKGMTLKDFQNCIITPHETELEMILINSGKEFLLPKLRECNAKEKADLLQGNLRYFLQNNNVLLLKGSTDIIISKNKISFNRTGNQGMTKAGTGDVLAGLAAGFLAKTGDLFKSASAAAYINGAVGDLLLRQKGGYSFIASDIIEDLEKIKKLEKGVSRRRATEVVKATPEATGKKIVVKLEKKPAAKKDTKLAVKKDAKPAAKKPMAKKESKTTSKKPAKKSTQLKK